MSRIDRRSASPGPLTRLLLWTARRKTAALTGRETERMLEPIEAYVHSPGLMMGYGTLEMAAARAHRVDARTKELAVLKAATIVHCEFCIDIGSSVARRAGISDEQLLALHRHRDSGLFSEPEVLVLDLAAAMTRTPVEVPDELYDALREHFDEAQLVELANIIALENLRSRFNAALDIGSAGFSEGMVCALPERTDATGAADPPTPARRPAGARA